MNDDLKMYIQFDKRDDDKRTVTGYASTEALDSQGEVVEKEAVANALPHYLGEYDQEKGRFKYGNLREMHQLSAVGKTIQAKVDERGLYIEGKVVDDNAWKKVKEGVYTGFSIGGKVLKQLKNRIKELRLTEISLVDRPANPEAVFSMIKINKAGQVTDMQMPEEPPQMEVMEAGAILDLAREIRMMMGMYEAQGKSTIEINRALNALKQLAARILSGEDKEKFEKILYGIDFKEIGKYTARHPEVKKEEKTMEINKYINTNWVPGYFDNLRKVVK